MVDADKRRERIALLRSLGFTHQQAFRFANAKHEKIEAAISQAKKDANSIPKSERTEKDNERIRAFRNVRIRNNSRILSIPEKKEQWSEWSSKNGNFPANALKRIEEFNDARGNDRFDEYGYQAYWFEYVMEYDVDFDTEFYVGDS